MAVIPIQCRLSADEHPGIRVRQLSDIGKLVHYAMGREWADDLLPEHFQPGAINVFGYQPRKRSTLIRKAKLAKLGVVQDGGLLPLVHTGRLRSMLTGHSQPVIGTANRTTVHLNGPSYFSIRPYKSGRPNLGAEVTAVSARHERLITAVADRTFHRALKQIPAKQFKNTK